MKASGRYILTDTNEIITIIKLGRAKYESLAEFHEDETKAAAIALKMAAAPRMIAALQRAYSVLADIHHEWPGRNTRDGQQLLCDMRDAISAALNLDAETVQNSGALAKATGGQP